LFVSIDCDGDDDDDDGEWVHVTQRELEGSGDEAGGLSRRIQLNLTVSSHAVSLTLERNDNVPSNVTVIIGQNRRLIRATPHDVSNRVCRSISRQRLLISYINL